MYKHLCFNLLCREELAVGRVHVCVCVCVCMCTWGEDASVMATQIVVVSDS